MSTQSQHLLQESVTRLLRRDALKNLAKILRRSRPADIAGVLRNLNDRDRVRIFQLVPEVELQAEVLSEADPLVQQVVLEHLSDEALLELIQQLSGDDAADLIERLPEERAARVLASWKGEDAAEVDTLLAYDTDTAGGIMSPHVFALVEGTTIREAIETLQSNHEDLEMAFYVYIVNDSGQLVGVCSLRQLVISDWSRTLGEIMDSDVVFVRTDADQEEVARLVARYNFLALPVVDDANRLVGVVTVDDIIDVIKEEATEDMLKMAGVGGEVGDLSDEAGVFRSARRRMPWLLASFASGILSMVVISAFETTLAQVAALAAFIPVTLAMGGNVGTQAATLMTRGLALGKVSSARYARVALREVLVGATLGVAYGVLLGLVATFVYPALGGAIGIPIWRLALTVSLSALFSMTVAAGLGGTMPLLFARIGVDPAVASGPLVTSNMDLIGITVYFVVGSLLIGL